VAIYLPKSALGVIVMHGVLKSGAAYVPIDPKAPSKRVAFILNNCAVRGLITTSKKLEQINKSLFELSSLKTILLTDQNKESIFIKAETQLHYWSELKTFDSQGPVTEPGIETDPAYLLYTSGSTGNPKGVILSHRHALTFVNWGVKTFGVHSKDRLSNHAPFHFDLSVFDIYVALQSGACVVIVPDKQALFPAALTKWIEAEKISIWYSVPSALIRLLLYGEMDKYEYKRLRAVLYAGEPFPVKYLREVKARMKYSQFYNLYGPAETNVCMYYRIPSKLGNDVSDIPIGKSCANTEVFAVKDGFQLIEAGQTGELCVKGPSLMNGYWDLQKQTSLSIITNPYQTAYRELIYRTGDIVRLEEDGNYTFVGRKDHMIKSRGYRIELGEIEKALYQHAQVKEAVVLAIPDPEITNRLIAVLVPHDNMRMTDVELFSFCVKRLPKYMIPETFIFKKRLPKTSTGKADRVKLYKSSNTFIKEAKVQ
jgi:amino acid adenylation domain-containing protein